MSGAAPAVGPRPPAVVLVRPQEQGNVGAVARAMANMGLAELLLGEPAAPLGEVARAFAVGAHGLLAGAARHASLAAALAPYRRVVATTAGRGRDWPVPLLVPRELPALLASDPPGTSTALVFGPEASGLTSEELALASAIVHVPCAPEQPTLNLAQAVLIVAYELFLERGAAAAPVAAGDPRATQAELAGLFAHLETALGRSGFARDDTIARVERDLRHLLARAAPSAREVSILRGLLRRFTHALDRAGGAPSGRARARGPRLG